MTTPPDQPTAPQEPRADVPVDAPRAAADAAARRGRRRFEIVATVLLAFAAVATAWSGYQAARWNGQATKASSQVNAVRIEAARAQGLAEGQTQVDIATFFEWVDAEQSGAADRATFYEERFRPEFRPAFDAWRAMAPPDDPTGAPGTPFALDEYQLAAAEEAADLDARADAGTAIVRTNLQRSSNYVLGVVLFSVALFFAGVSTKMTNPTPRSVLLACGCVVFLATAMWILTSPISIAV